MSIQWDVITKTFNSSNSLEKVEFDVSLSGKHRSREFEFQGLGLFNPSATDEEILDYIKENMGLGQKEALEVGLTAEANLAE
jgi:hypothetical protein